MSRRKEEQASEEEEEENDEDAGCWEYDSTWEDDEEKEEEEEETGERDLEEGQERRGSEEAPAENTGEAKREKPQLPVCRWSPNARWARGSQQRRRNHSSSFTNCPSASGRNWIAARDMQRYRQHYPGLEEKDTEIGEDDMWNLSFYKNEICFMPHGLHIDDLLETWQNDYETLEGNHSYIQWLFPLREKGMNWRAKILTCQEIQAFKKSKEVMRRFVQSYKLMLGFYGIELINEETGELRRAKNWWERFENLNRYSHNNLRITRILKCLGEMGYEHYQVHLVKFFLTETLINKTLPRVLRSALDYFMFTVRNKQKRRELVHFAWLHYDPNREFVWGLRKRLLKFKPRSPEFLTDWRLESEQQSDGDADGEAVRKDKSSLPNETFSAGLAADKTIRQSVSKANTKPRCPLDDAVPGKATERESTSMIAGNRLETGDAAGSQTRVAGGKASEMAHKPNSPESTSKVEAGNSGRKKGGPGLFLLLEKGSVVGESGNSGGGADGESTKESKKRKLEMSRLSGGSAGSLRSPTDIEKISFNLEEVVIDNGGPSSRPFAEKAELSVAEGGCRDDKDAKEAESADAVIKRRKVDEMTSKDNASEMVVKANVASLQDKITNCTVPSFKETTQVCQGDAEIIDGAPVETLADSRTIDVGVLVNSKTSREPHHPLDDSAPDRTNEQGTTSAIKGEILEPHESIPNSGREEDGNTGLEEGVTEEKAAHTIGMNTAPKLVESKNLAEKPLEDELHPK